MSKTLETSYASVARSGNIGSSVNGPERSKKEVIIIGGSVLVFAVAMGIAWMSTQDDVPTGNATAPVTSLPVPAPVAAPISQPAEGILSHPVATSLPTQLKDSLHADVHFDFGRNRLSEEAKTYLAAYADFLKKETDWGVVIQGYTDNRGSASYNKKLGVQRAETVRAFLAGLGIPDTSMKVVSLGKEGTLCQDDSTDCQQLNRRVHLEFIKVGAAHLAPPVPTEVIAPEVLSSEILPMESTAERASTDPSTIGGETVESGEAAPDQTHDASLSDTTP